MQALPAHHTPSCHGQEASVPSQSDPLPLVGRQSCSLAFAAPPASGNSNACWEQPGLSVPYNVWDNLVRTWFVIS